MHVTACKPQSPMNYKFKMYVAPTFKKWNMLVLEYKLQVVNLQPCYYGFS
jgi:hypothetical protein